MKTMMLKKNKIRESKMTKRPVIPTKIKIKKMKPFKKNKKIFLANSDWNHLEKKF